MCDQLLKAWFGDPKDPVARVHIFDGPAIALLKIPLLGDYVIFIDSTLRGGQIHSAIAYEMYYRITSRSGGLNRHMWVKVMMAL